MAMYRVFNPFVLLTGEDLGGDDGDLGGDDEIIVVGGYTGIGQDPGSSGTGDSANGIGSFEEWSALNGGSFEEYRDLFMGLYGEDYVTANAQWALLNPDAGILYPDI